MQAIKDYDTNKWKVIGQKVGKPAKVSNSVSSLFRSYFRCKAATFSSGCPCCSQATGPSFATCSRRFRHADSADFHPTRLEGYALWRYPIDYSELAISYSRHVKPAVHHHPVHALAVNNNMLFFFPFPVSSNPYQDCRNSERNE